MQQLITSFNQLLFDAKSHNLRLNNQRFLIWNVTSPCFTSYIPMFGWVHWLGGSLELCPRACQCNAELIIINYIACFVPAGTAITLPPFRSHDLYTTQSHLGGDFNFPSCFLICSIKFGSHSPPSTNLFF